MKLSDNKRIDILDKITEYMGHGIRIKIKGEDGYFALSKLQDAFLLNDSTLFLTGELNTDGSEFFSEKIRFIELEKIIEIKLTRPINKLEKE